MLRTVLHSASERFHELRYGVVTSGWKSEEDLGYKKGDGRVHYTPIPYLALKHLLSAVQPSRDRDIFIDWGSGLGRVLVLASAYPYREVIGVEASAPLCNFAKRNIARSRVERVCENIRVVNTDALDFDVPKDASVMFFYNPFRGELLTRVVRNIRQSWERYPRRITFLVSNHSGFIADTGSGDWLSISSEWSAYPNLGCAVIRSR